VIVAWDFGMNFHSAEGENRCPSMLMNSFQMLELPFHFVCDSVNLSKPSEFFTSLFLSIERESEVKFNRANDFRYWMTGLAPNW
jgi:hypothetical protein